MQMHNPPHPGQIIRDLYMEPLELTVTAAAKGLGVSRNTLSELLNGKNGISTEMAYRLSKAFGHTPKSWLNLQTLYDLAQAKEQGEALQVERLYDPEPIPA